MVTIPSHVKVVLFTVYWASCPLFTLLLPQSVAWLILTSSSIYKQSHCLYTSLDIHMNIHRHYEYLTPSMFIHQASQRPFVWKHFTFSDTAAYKMPKSPESKYLLSISNIISISPARVEERFLSIPTSWPCRVPPWRQRCRSVLPSCTCRWAP